MLPHTYRYAAYNDSGASVTVTITERRWKFDSSGAKDDDTENTYSIGSVSNGVQGESSTVDNSTDKYIGADLTVTASGAGSGGVVTIFLEASTDGGTDWPDAQGGKPIGSVDPDGTADVVNMEV